MMGPKSINHCNFRLNDKDILVSITSMQEIKKHGCTKNFTFIQSKLLATYTNKEWCN